MTELQKQNSFFTFNVQVSIGLFLLATGFAVFNNTFSLAFHADEWKKAMFVIENRQDFHHPILMLQFTRIADLFIGAVEWEDAVIIGRWVSAIMFGLIAVFTFQIAQKFMHRNWAMLVGAVVITSPILVVHAHYMKEDIIQTAFLYISIWQFIRLAQNPDKRNTILLGLFTGLALSSHYKSVMLAVVLGSAPFFIGIKKSWKLYPKLLVAAGISLVVFVLVNYPMLIDFDNFYKGFEHERTHALEGHSIRIYPLSHFFMYHLRHSLIKGMTLPIMALSGIGILHLLARWKQCNWMEKMLFVHILVFYFIIEISPTKPYPDFMRYAIPVVPALAIFAVKGFRKIVEMFPLYQKLVIAIFTIAMLSTPLYVTGRLLDQLKTEEDPRYKAKVWLEEHNAKPLFEMYASMDKKVHDVDNPGLIDGYREEGITHLVYCSFTYQRFLDAKDYKGQTDLAYIKAKFFEEIFSTYPYFDIEPPYKWFAFSGPTIRIVDIREKKATN